jgi:transmembrane sensor
MASLPDDTLDRIARHLTDDTAESDAEFVRWLDADRARRDLYEQLSAIWLRAGQKPAGGTWDLSRALGKIHDATAAQGPTHHVLRLHESAAASRAPAWRWPTRSNYARAAGITAVLVGLGAGGWWLGARPRSPEAAASATAELRTVTTGAGERATIGFPDGSRVTLGPMSTLEYAANLTGTANPNRVNGVRKAERVVQLEGEGYFVVVHNAGRAFVVRTARATARDLGTRFLVRAYAGDRSTDVVVTEGAVTLTAASDGSGAAVPSGHLELRANDRGTIDEHGGLRAERGVDVDDALAWTRGELVFTNTPVRDVIAEVRRWYGVDLRVLEPLQGPSPSAVERVRFTARFTGEPARVVARELAKTLRGRVEESGQALVIHVPAVP